MLFRACDMDRDDGIRYRLARRNAGPLMIGDWLSGFFYRANTGPVITGIIAADIFATIAATSNSMRPWHKPLRSIFAATASTLTNIYQDLWIPVVLIGALTMVLSLFLHSTVKDLLLFLRSSEWSWSRPRDHPATPGGTLRYPPASIVAGFATAAVCISGLNATINEAAPGMAAAW